MDLSSLVETDGATEERDEKQEKLNKVGLQEPTADNVPRLQNGFGFTSDTMKFRIHVDTNRENETKTQCEQVEIDAIYIRNSHVCHLAELPGIPHDYVDTCKQSPAVSEVKCFCAILKRSKRPDAESGIRIPHSKADTPEGDDFGALLGTFEEKRKDRGVYYRHILVKVNPHGPAAQMRLETNDELVLINGDFTPYETHEETLGLFRDVKVDGKTRFTLVIRRLDEDKEWEWIETSAILSPDKDHEHLPDVKPVAYKQVRSEQIEVPKAEYLYKAPGTQKYLDICDGKVSIDILNGSDTDRTKIIWKRAKYWMDNDGHIDYAAALKDITETWYIGVNEQSQIVLCKEPVWFKMIKQGSKVRFQFKETYLGYDCTSGHVKASVDTCVFEELPAGTLNISSCPADHMAELADDVNTPDVRSQLNSSSSSLGGHSDKRTITLSESCVDSYQSSISSSRNSYDFNGSIMSSRDSVESGVSSITLSETNLASDRNGGLSVQKGRELMRVFADFPDGFADDRSSGYRSDNNKDSDANLRKHEELNMIENNCKAKNDLRNEQLPSPS